MTTSTSSDDQQPAERTAATGEQWVIGHGDQRAVVTEVGATLRSFTVADRPVLAGFGPEQWSTGGRGQVLAPWPNRLGDGRYTFEGVEAQAPLDEPAHGNAIHGLVRWLPWRMAGRAQNRVALSCELHPSPAFPFALRLTIEYRLGRGGLTVVTDADNVGSTDLPFGIGFHPYFGVGTTSIDHLRLQVPATDRLITDDRGLPTGRAPVSGTEFDFRQGRLIGVTRLDTGYGGLVRTAEGRACVELDHPDGPGGTTVWADERFHYFMIYTGDTLDPAERRTAVAVEPMSCPPDAFRSGVDLVVLQPGGRWTGAWGVIPR